MARKKIELYVGIALVLIALFELLGLFNMVGINLSGRFYHLILAIVGVFLIYKGM